MNINDVVVKHKDSIKNRFTDNCYRKKAEQNLYSVVVQVVRQENNGSKTERIYTFFCAKEMRITN
jgi:hypothetical protein